MLNPPAEIARHTGLRNTGLLRRALDGLDEKGVLQHTDEAIEKYSLLDSWKNIGNVGQTSIAFKAT
jgi:hypothetical protein